MRGHKWSGVELDGLPHLQRWKDEIAERPAVQKGITVPEYREPAPEKDERVVEDARKMLA